MFIIPIGIVGERGYFVLTSLVAIACAMSFAFLSDERVDSTFAYFPGTLNVLRMLTSEFMHRDIFHLLGNLFFFFGFASSVEKRTNSLVFVLVFLFIALFENLAYHFASLKLTEALPTIGLSGVVWGFMGLFLTLNPKAEIDCLVIYPIGVNRIEVPSWIFILGFLALEIGEFRHEANSAVNHVAHFGGVAAGLLARVLIWPLTSAESRTNQRASKKPRWK